MGRGNQQEYDQGWRTGKGSTLSGAQGARDAARAKQEKAHRQKLNDWAAQSARQTSSGSGGSKTSGCFIATAAFADFDAPEVLFLRTFRDECLAQNAFGRALVRLYYTVSPPLADVIARSESLRSGVRRYFLQPLILVIKRARK